MERLRRRFGFVNGINVLADGTLGGLCLGWHDEIDVELRGYCASCVDVLITDADVDGKWRFSSFYGAPKGNHRLES